MLFDFVSCCAEKCYQCAYSPPKTVYEKHQGYGEHGGHGGGHGGYGHQQVYIDTFYNRPIINYMSLRLKRSMSKDSIVAAESDVIIRNGHIDRPN